MSLRKKSKNLIFLAQRKKWFELCQAVYKPYPKSLTYYMVNDTPHSVSDMYPTRVRCMSTCPRVRYTDTPQDFHIRASELTITALESVLTGIMSSVPYTRHTSFSSRRKDGPRAPAPGNPPRRLRLMMLNSYYPIHNKKKTKKRREANSIRQNSQVTRRIVLLPL